MVSLKQKWLQNLNSKNKQGAQKGKRMQFETIWLHVCFFRILYILLGLVFKIFYKVKIIYIEQIGFPNKN